MAVEPATMPVPMFPAFRDVPAFGDTAEPDALVAMPAGKEEELACYSQMHFTEAEVVRPADVHELRMVLAQARHAGRSVTLRAGGNAFDAQSLGSDLVISLSHLDHIGDVVEVGGEPHLTVGAGATWGKILDVLSVQGLAPAVMVTTHAATAGGTLSGDCLSRFSPTFGKEGGWVRGFRMLTIGGEDMTCTPPADLNSPDAWTLQERTFVATIGGLGYIGAVYEITYALVRVCEPAADGKTPKVGLFGAKTTLRKHKTYDDLATQLVEQAKQMRRAEAISETAPHAAHREQPQAIYSTLIRRLSGKQSSIVFTSQYTTSTKRKPMAIHQPKTLARFISEMLLRTRIGWLLSLAAYHLLFRQGTTYIDDLRGFTFFMDGNARAKAWGKAHGMKLPTVQQTFVLPFDPAQPQLSDEQADAERATRLVRWLDESHELLGEYDLDPTFMDVLFIRDTGPYGLSANAGQAGFAVSFAFETSSEKKLAKVIEAFQRLADKLVAYDGRVYLVKNVYASQATLATMYGEHAISFFKLKRRLDPDCLLDNDFLTLTFGDLVREVYAGVHGEDDSQ